MVKEKNKKLLIILGVIALIMFMGKGNEGFLGSAVITTTVTYTGDFDLAQDCADVNGIILAPDGIIFPNNDWGNTMPAQDSYADMLMCVPSTLLYSEDSSDYSQCGTCPNFFSCKTFTSTVIGDGVYNQCVVNELFYDETYQIENYYNKGIEIEVYSSENTNYQVSLVSSCSYPSTVDCDTQSEVDIVKAEYQQGPGTICTLDQRQSCINKFVGDGSCTDSEWIPLTSNVPEGIEFTQISNCGTQRNAIGTDPPLINTSHCAFSGLLGWGNYCIEWSTVILIGALFFMLMMFMGKK